MTLQTRTDTRAQACLDLASVFQHPLLEEAATPATARERHEQRMLVHQAEQACLDCPLMQHCLYRAVVEHEVAGFVAGTTQRQRQEIRARLGVRVNPEDLDAFTGAGRSHHQVDTGEVLRLRRQNPHESLENLAHRLGCSLSTVKRHLRRARTEQFDERQLTDERDLATVRPSMKQVLHATRLVLERSSAPRRRAASAA